MSVVALAATVVAARAWRRAVVLTPDGIIVHPVLERATTTPWNRVHPGYTGGHPKHLGVDPDFLAWAVVRYCHHANLRAAIGTELEHERLRAEHAAGRAADGPPRSVAS